jgi:hypothetical protein
MARLLNPPQREWQTLAGLAVAVIFAGYARGQRDADLPQPSVLLDALRTTIEAVNSFEVRVETRTEWYFSEQVLVDGRPQPGLHVYEKPKVDRALSRQLYLQGWRRIEILNPKTGDVEQALGADTEVERIISFPSQRGVIRRAGLEGIPWGRDYQETFRTVCCGIPTDVVFHERIKNVRVRRVGQYIVMEVDPARGTFGKWGFRVYADTGANFLPAKTETFRIEDGEQQLLARMTVTQRKKISSSLEVPIKAVTEFYSVSKAFGKFQEVSHRIYLTVDVTRSRWNEGVSEDAMRVSFPAGLLVTDEIRDVVFVVGKADPGKNLEDLAANAKVVAAHMHSEDTGPTQWNLWMWAGIPAVLIGFVVSFFLFRRHSAKSTA